MAWSTVKSTGSGAVAWRLMFPGHPYEAVSDPALIGAGTHGRLRLGGLDARSISWGERLDPSKCKLTARGFTARIIEDGSNRWGDSFVKSPTTIGYLASNVVVADGTVNTSATTFATNDVIYMGAECMLVTTGGSTALTVTRAYRDTVAQCHYVDTTIGITRPEITSSRPSIEGTLAKLYAYGDGETGDGTLVWTGVVSTQPRLRDLGVWEISVDSVASILDQPLSGDLQDPVALRGIEYHDATAPGFRLLQLNTASATATTVSQRAFIPSSWISGAGPTAFYETQAEFCEALTQAFTDYTDGTIGTAWAVPLNPASGAGPRLVAHPTADGSWALQYTAASASEKWLSVVSDGAPPIDPRFDGAYSLIDISTGIPVRTVSASGQYLIGISDLPPVDGAGTTPRGFAGVRGTSTTVFYLGGTATTSVGEQLLVQWPDAGTRTARTIAYEVTAWDSSTRKATVRNTSTSPDLQRPFTSSTLPEITISRWYAQGTVAAFLAAMVADAAVEAPAGRQPFITTEHIDTTTTTTNVNAITSGRAWLEQRVYAGASDVALSAMLTEECKLYGMVPSIGTDGRIVLVEWRIGAGTEATAYTIDASTNLSGASPPGFEPSAFGLVNIVRLKTGWDALTSVHHGQTFYVKDSASLSRNPLPSMMKIEPRSSWFGDVSIPHTDVVAMAHSWLGTLGAAYATITVVCPLSAMDATIGTRVSVTIDQIPDTENGGRGVSAIGGVVIGRDVKPLEATVELTVLTSQLRLSGYTPSSRIASNALVSGTTYDVTLEASQPDGYTTAATWTVGDLVALVQYDVVTPTTQTGTISAVDSATRVIRVVLAGAIPSGTLNLEYGLPAVATTHQQTYCYVAQDDDLIGFTVNVTSRQFAA